MDVQIIGIAGGSGSGKSTFARAVQRSYPDQILRIACDNYYRAHDDLSLEEREKLNYDAPDALDFSLLCKHLQQLKAGQAIDCPVYDFSLHTRSEQTLHIEPKPVILVDGILLFSDPEVRRLLDLKIFVETDADERILRRTKRDVLERGRTLESVIQQYLSTVKPMHNLYVEPARIFADLIINGGMDSKAVEVVTSWITCRLLHLHPDLVMDSH